MKFALSLTALLALAALAPAQDTAVAYLTGRVAELERRVEALEARAAVTHLTAPSAPAAPQPAAYYVAAPAYTAPAYTAPAYYGAVFGDAGGCGPGDCGPAAGGYRFMPFGGRFRR